MAGASAGCHAHTAKGRCGWRAREGSACRYRCGALAPVRMVSVPTALSLSPSYTHTPSLSHMHPRQTHVRCSLPHRDSSPGWTAPPHAWQLNSGRAGAAASKAGHAASGCMHTGERCGGGGGGGLGGGGGGCGGGHSAPSDNAAARWAISLRFTAAQTAVLKSAATSAALGVVRGAARKACADACTCRGSGSVRQLRGRIRSLLSASGGGGGANAAEASAASYASVIASPHLARCSIHRP